jgi:hypothetical protein
MTRIADYFSAALNDSSEDGEARESEKETRIQRYKPFLHRH